MSYRYHVYLALFVSVSFLTSTIITNIRLNGVVKSLADTQKKLKDSEQLLSQKDSQIETLLNKQAEQISILDESISPNDKRWAKIKKVRQAVINKIKENGYVKIPDINGLTTYASSVVEYSEQYDVPVPLILAVTQQESAFNPLALSPAGAQGLMQLMPDTARECASDINKNFFSIFKIRDNVQLGTWYLYRMLNLFEGNTELAVRAYNAGPVYVKRVLSGELNNFPRETIEYHKKVMQYRQQFVDLGL